MRATPGPVAERTVAETASDDEVSRLHVTSFLVEVRTHAHVTADSAVDIVTKKLNAAFQDSEFDITIVPTANTAPEATRGARKRGEARLVDWTQDGTLVDGSQVEKAWGVKRQTVDAARERGEIFSMWVKNKHWYPKDALNLQRSALSAINRALGDIDPSSKLLFLLHRHGALGGNTPADAVEASRLDDVVRLARDWART